MVATVICGTAVGIAVWIITWTSNPTFSTNLAWGGAIGAVVGSLLWGLLGYTVCRDKNAAEPSSGQPNIMSPTQKTLIVVLVGMSVMIVTTACGCATPLLWLLPHNNIAEDMSFWRTCFCGGVIGAVVGVPIWVWLGYMVCRDKNSAPNEVIPDNSIHDAAAKGNIEAVKKHLSDDANVNAKDNDGKTPLDSAIDFKHTEIAALLRKQGAKTEEELKAEQK